MGLVPGQQASADGVVTQDIGGDITRYQWEYYTTQRTTNAYPNRISFNKTDGPEINMYMRGCGPSQGQGNGPVVNFQDEDPQDDEGHQRLRETHAYGITFCLAAYSLGNNSTDTFDGELAWWVSWV